MMKYTVWAHSPSLNEWQRQFDLSNMSKEPNLAEAQRDADAFAGILNRDRKQNATDWHGVVKHEELGIQTIPGYIRHTGG